MKEIEQHPSVQMRLGISDCSRTTCRIRSDQAVGKVVRISKATVREWTEVRLRVVHVGKASDKEAAAQLVAERLRIHRADVIPQERF